jgi:thiamine-phosphate pyrophosphorylase
MAPGLIVLTDRRMAGRAGHDVVAVVAAAVRAGAPAVLVREKDMSRSERLGLARRLRSVSAAAGAELLVAGDGALAREVGADGVHLAAADDPETGTGLRVGRSCHTVDDLRAAAAAGLDYVTFSPVFATASKPGYGPSLGIEGLAAGVRAVAGAGGRRRLPVYALGGIGPGEVVACRTAGAAGVAVMGAVMRADDPGKVVRAIMDAMVGRGVARGVAGRADV